MDADVSLKRVPYLQSPSTQKPWLASRFLFGPMQWNAAARRSRRTLVIVITEKSQMQKDVPNAEDDLASEDKMHFLFPLLVGKSVRLLAKESKIW